MSLYLFFLIVLLLSSIYEIFGQKQSHKLYLFLWFIMTLMCTLRYGQGTDYFNYQLIYNYFDGKIVDLWGIYRDPFFSLLFTLFQHYKIDFVYVMAFVGLLSTGLLGYAIKRDSKYPIFSLFIVYALFHLTYHYSAIREGLAISFFLVFMYPLLKINKFSAKYFVYAIIAYCMHGSALITLLFPFLQKIYSKRFFGVFLLSCITLSFIVWKLPFLSYAILKDRTDSYIEVNTFNIYAVASRLFVLIPLVFVRLKDDDSMRNVINNFVSFIFIYLIFVSNSTLSARLSIYLQILVIYVWPYTVAKLDLNRAKIFFVMIAFLVFMYAKCINSYIITGDYKNGIDVINYPYCSIFDRNEINKYRYI